VLMGGIFAAKFGGAGAHLWSRGFGTLGVTDRPDRIVVDNGGDLVLYGQIAGTSLAFDSYVLSNPVSEDLFLTRLDSSDGAALGAVGFEATGGLTAYGVAVHPATRAVVVAGQFATTLEFGSNVHTSQGNDGFIASLGAVP
jgi:hypothetical protein